MHPPADAARPPRSAAQDSGIGLVHGMGGSAGVGLLLLAHIHDRLEALTALGLFAGFTAIYFDEPLSWTVAAGFALIALGAALVFHGQA